MTRKKLGEGPWWVVGTFDAEWRVLSVEPAEEPGEALVDLGSVKKLRLLDAPICEWREACRTAFHLRHRYEGKHLGPAAKPGSRKTSCKAVHVDRNPPNFPNRFA